MAYFKAKITRKEAEELNPIAISYCQEPMWSKGDHVAYNSGYYGWNWDLIKYRGRYYVSGYRNYPKTTKRVKPKKSKSAPFGL